MNKKTRRTSVQRTPFLHRSLATAAILAAITAAPGAFAVEIPNVTNAIPGSNTGVLIDITNDFFSYDPVGPTAINSNRVFNAKDITLNTPDTKGPVIGFDVQGNASGFTFSWDTINVLGKNGTNSNVLGFRYSPGGVIAFTGTINGGDIIVNGTPGDRFLTGLGFTGNDINGNVSVGDITMNEAGNAASTIRAVHAGSLMRNRTLSIGNILINNSRNTTGNLRGIQLGGDIQAGAKLNIESVSINNTANSNFAQGINIDGANAGEINITGDAGTYGISVISAGTGQTHGLELGDWANPALGVNSGTINIANGVFVQNTNTTGIAGGDGVAVAVKLDGGNTGTVNIGDIRAESANAQGWAIGFRMGDSADLQNNTGSITLGNVDITSGSTGLGVRFAANGNNTAAGKNASFTAGNITVTTTDLAEGVIMRGTNYGNVQLGNLKLTGGANNGITGATFTGNEKDATIIVGDITSQSSNHHNYGLWMNKDNKGSMVLGKIDVSSSAVTAHGTVGLNFSGDNTIAGQQEHVEYGDVSFESLKVQAVSDAVGIYAVAPNAIKINALVDVKSDTGNAYGVNVKAVNNMSSTVTVAENAVFKTDAAAGQALGINFNPPTAGNARNAIVFDHNTIWDNDKNAFSTNGANEMVFASGATILRENHTLIASGPTRNTAPTATVKAGAALILDAAFNDVPPNPTILDLTNLGATNGTLLVEEGGFVDGFSTGLPLGTFALVAGQFDLQGTAVFRGQDGENHGIGFTNANVPVTPAIKVGKTAHIETFITDGSDEGSFQVARGRWETADAATAQMNRNSFYNLTAFNFDQGAGYEDAFIGYDLKPYADIPEMYVLAAQMHNYRTIANAVASRMDNNFVAKTRYSSEYRGQECDPCAAVCGDMRTKKHKRGQEAWLAWDGAVNDEIQSNFDGQNMRMESNGVQIGYDLYNTKRFMLGAMFGYNEGRLYANDGFGSKLKGEDTYFGFYGQMKFRRGMDLRATAGYGHQKFKQDRANRFGNHHSRFKSDTFESSLDLGYQFNLRRNKNVTIRPMIGLDIYNYDTDGGQEDGFPADRIAYQGMSLTQVFLRTGASMTWSRNRLNVNAGAFYSYQMNKDAKYTWANVSALDQGGATLALFNKLGRSIVDLNIGASYALGKKGNLSLFGGYNASIFTDRENDQATHSGNLGLNYKF